MITTDDIRAADIVLPEIYAVDTTFLLAANSALFPTQQLGLRDKDHDTAFKTFITYITNGRSFHYVRPGVSQAIRTFPILELLTSSPARAKTVGLTPEGDEETWEEAARDFMTYVEFSGGADVVEWVRFQFDDDDVVQVFFDGGEDKQVARLLKAHEVLQASPALAQLRNLWAAAGALSMAPKGRHADCARRAFGTFADYSLAYAFFGFAKGQFYPLQLVEQQRHCVHWLREIAMDKLALRLSSTSQSPPSTSDIEQRDPPESGLCLGWGSIVLELAKRDERLRSAGQLGDVLAVLRRETTSEALSAILAAGDRKTSETAEAARRAACEDFVTGALLKTSWDPAPANEKAYRNRAKAMARVLGGIVGAIPAAAAAGPMGALGGFLGGILLSGARQLDLVVESRWYTRADFRMTRRFFRERLFKQFSRSAIGPAVDAFAAERKQESRTSVEARRK